MKELVIQPSKEGKGRSFAASLVSYVTADALWHGGQASTETERPIWMMVAGTDNELRPFVANLQLGRKAEVLGSGYSKKTDKFEVLKSAGFHAAWQRSPLGTVVTLFEPDLFCMDPGMVDPTRVSFCLLPAASWLTQVNVDEAARAYLPTLGYDVPEDRIETILRTAPLFIAYLDRRTRCPIIPDQRFYVQILCAALDQGLADWGRDPDKYHSHYSERPFGDRGRLGFNEYDTNIVGLAPGIAFDASQDAVEQMLATEVTVFFNRINGVS